MLYPIHELLYEAIIFRMQNYTIDFGEGSKAQTILLTLQL